MSNNKATKFKYFDEMDNYDFNENEKEPNYLMACIVGLITSVLVGFGLAFLGMWTESEYTFVLIFGGLIVSYVLRHFLPKESIAGAIIGAILTPVAYIIYQVYMNKQGYSYGADSEVRFWFILLLSIAMGAGLGYNKDNE